MGRPGLAPAGGGLVVSALTARGEVWWCELPKTGRRPVVVLSRDAVIPRHVVRAALPSPSRWTAPTDQDACPAGDSLGLGATGADHRVGASVARVFLPSRTSNDTWGWATRDTYDERCRRS